MKLRLNEGENTKKIKKYLIAVNRDKKINWKNWMQTNVMEESINAIDQMKEHCSKWTKIIN